MQKDFLYSEHWKRNLDDAEMRIDIWKTEGGIMQEMYLRNTRIMRVVSPRPYQLGQACDGTIDTCVHALFIAFCRTMHLSPAAIYEQAYRNGAYLNEAEQDALMRKAVMEGVTFPTFWDQQAYDGLLTSLTEINNHTLVSLLEDMKLFNP